MNEKKFLSYLERYSQWFKAHKEKSTEELAEVFKVVAPHYEQLNVYGHAIRNIIILACTELDARMQNILANNGVNPNRKYFEMKDYFKLNAPLKLDEYELSFNRYGDLRTFSPFSAWDNDKQLDWYKHTII